MRIALIILLTIAIGLGLYVRLAPVNPEHWHAMPDDVGTRGLSGGAMRVIDAPEGGLEQLHAIIVATPRTKVLAGNADEGLVTYVTRSLVVGFPDYTTVRIVETRLEIYGRSRFGRSDFGVNAARIDGWLKRLAEGG